MRLPQPSSAHVVLTLNRQVPPHRRRWNDITKQLWINDSHIDVVEELLRAHYPAYNPYEDG